MRIELENGHYCELVGDKNEKVSQGGALLGEGGEGRVYKVTYSKDNKFYALKIYKKDPNGRYRPGSDFINNLKQNIEDGPPTEDGLPSTSFIWPIAMTKLINNEKLGYLMELYSENFKGLNDLLTNRVKFNGIKSQLRAMIEIAEAFKDLHLNGKSFQDFNDGGVVFDVQTGEIKICDCDNVAPYGKTFGILGKGSYMAPEIRARIGIKPDKYSDYLSMASVFFELLTHDEPYSGRLTIDESVNIPGYNDDTPIPDNILFGDLATYVYDPADNSNRPMAHQNIRISSKSIPNSIKDLFERTFTKGMPKKFRTSSTIDQHGNSVSVFDLQGIRDDRQQRTTDDNWLKELYRWNNFTCKCPQCGLANIMEVNIETGNVNIVQTQCINCHTILPMDIPVIELTNGGHKHIVLLSDGQNIYSLHTDIQGDFSIIAKGYQSPNYYPSKNQGHHVYFFHNLTGRTLQCFGKYPDGNIKKVDCENNGYIVCRNGYEIKITADCTAKVYSPISITEQLNKG